jgi:POT family proton-dependent oligopeptide transporter
MSAAAEQNPVQTTLKSVVAKETPTGHPRGLYFLFFTEMWERFGYYGMRALLVLYMLNYLQFQPAASSNVYKWYTSLVYLTPLIGGFLADRFLGLRPSIIVGGVLMACGYLMLTSEPLFYPALGLIIAGNGFFKPNISTIVGKMYKPGDARRDGAFTIFYMGINLGAGIAPLVCGGLRNHFGNVGFKYGFAAAGIGMIVGLTVFLVGQRRVLKDVEAAGNDLKIGKPASTDASGKKDTLGSAEATELGAGGISGAVAKVFPLLMIGVAVGVPIYYLILVFQGKAPLQDAIMPIAFALISGLLGFTLMTIKGASRDRSTVIFILFMFAVLFWMAFEQAGNALNIWADVHTDRHIGTWGYPAEYFQSVNAVFIVALGPVFAAAWVWLARIGKEPPTAVKMFLGLVFMTASFGAMAWGAAIEHRTVSEVSLAAVPAGVNVSELDAGRMAFDPAKHELTVHGVLPPFALNLALRRTASKGWIDQVDALEAAANDASDKAPLVRKVDLPPSWEAPLADKEASEAGLSWDATTGEIKLTKPLAAPTKTALINAGAQPEWRQALRELAKKSDLARVSAFWLVLSYLLATFGELCLSPVGLSMVTKLAPVRFASLFMGVWLLASSVAQYVGGAIGESWGAITPTSYFMVFVTTSIGGVVALAILIVPLRKLMHKVH